MPAQPLELSATRANPRTARRSRQECWNIGATVTVKELDIREGTKVVRNEPYCGSVAVADGSGLNESSSDRAKSAVSSLTEKNGSLVGAGPRFNFCKFCGCSASGKKEHPPVARTTRASPQAAGPRQECWNMGILSQ